MYSDINTLARRRYHFGRRPTGGNATAYSHTTRLLLWIGLAGISWAAVLTAGYFVFGALAGGL